MNKRQALEIVEKAAANQAKTDLMSFIQYVKFDYSPQWFHRVITSYCEKILKKEIKKLMIFVPPQHGKSEIVSRQFPAYALGQNPNLKVVGCSYSSDLAKTFSRDIQRTIDGDRYHDIFPETQLNSKNSRTDLSRGYIRTVEKFEIVGKTGSFKAVGVGGSLTGNPIDIGIIDDPIKDAVEANSYTYRERIWDWYVNVFKTRLHNDSCEIIMLTRWHTDDLAGRLLQKEGKEWTIVLFEGIYTTPSKYDPRKLGQALWPGKHSLKRLKHMQTLSPQTFAALIQQNPNEAQAGNEFLGAFNEQKHVTEDYTYSPNEPIHISIDNNVFPYIAVTLWQMIRFENGWLLYQVKELPAKDPINTARQAGLNTLKWLNENNHLSAVFLYGDPTTKQRNTISDEKKSFLELFEDPFKRDGIEMQRRFFNKAPPVASTGEFMNEILRGQNNYIKMLINEDCTLSIADYKNTKKDENGGILKQRVKDPSGISYEKNGHILDTWRYLLCKAFEPEFNKFLNRFSDYSDKSLKDYTPDLLQGF